MFEQFPDAHTSGKPLLANLLKFGIKLQQFAYSRSNTTNKSILIKILQVYAIIPFLMQNLQGFVIFETALEDEFPYLLKLK